MLGNNVNNISADAIFCVWSQYFLGGRELNFHWKRIIGYKGERNYAHQPSVTTLSRFLSPPDWANELGGGG